MADSHTTADKVRPILKAMERSIESARRQRTDGDEPDVQSTPMSNGGHPRPSAPVRPSTPHIIREDRSERDEDEIIHPAQRMKAKPKRSSFSDAFNDRDSEYRSRAS